MSKAQERKERVERRRLQSLMHDRIDDPEKGTGWQERVVNNLGGKTPDYVLRKQQGALRVDLMPTLRRLVTQMSEKHNVSEMGFIFLVLAAVADKETDTTLEEIMATRSHIKKFGSRENIDFDPEYWRALVRD